MPTYEYRCKACDHEMEVVQKFTDDPLETCPECEGPLRKVYGAVGISFKGSGFYKTDTRPKSKSKSKAASTPADTSSGSSDTSSSSSDSSSSSSSDSSSSSSSDSGSSSSSAA